MDRRGVSPVIAVLLLVVITVAAAVLVYIWLIGFMQSQTTTTGATALGEKIKFESAELDASSKTFKAYVRNVGDTTTYLVSVYLLKADGQTVVEAKTSYTGPGFGVAIEPGNVQYVEVAFSATIESNKVYVIKVVTALGTEFTVRVKAS
mgnify:CR=1 FL=1